MSLPDWLVQPAVCVELVMRLTAISTALCAAEGIAACSHYANDAVLGWPLLKQRSRLHGDGTVAALLGVVFRHPGIIVMHWVWLLAALVLFFTTSHPVIRPAALFVLFVIQALVHVRQFCVALVGGDRMRLLLLGALTLREIAPDGELATRATLLFIGANCTLAYFVAGLYHLPMAEWRAGRALIGVLRHPFYGDPKAADWLARHLWVCRTLTWGALVLEAGFPLALLGGAQTMMPALAATLLMHLAIGHLMGLPRFVWAFLAAYPAVIFTSTQVHDWLFR